MTAINQLVPVKFNADISHLHQLMTVNWTDMPPLDTTIILDMPASEGLVNIQVGTHGYVMKLTQHRDAGRWPPTPSHSS